MISLKTEKKIAWSTVVQVAGKGFQILILALTVKQITRYLGPENYGLYGRISEMLLFFATVGNLGIFGNTVRKLSENPHDGNAFSNAFLLRVFTAIPLLTIPLLLLPRWGVLFFAFSLFFEYIISVCDAALQAHYRMGWATAALVGGRLLNLLIVLLLIELQVEKQADLFFLAPLVGSFFTAAFSFFLVRQRLSWSWTLDWKSMRILLFASIPFGLINILNNLYFRFLPSYFSDKILTDAEFSSFNISLRMASFASLLSTLFMFSVLPTLKRSLKEGHHQKAKELFGLSKKILLALGVALVAGGSLLGPVIIPLLTGKDFFLPQFWFMFPLFLLLAAISYSYDLVLVTLFALEQELWFLKRECVALAVSVPVFLLSLLPLSHPQGVFWILVAAIVGETTMVVLGFKRAKALLAKA